MAQCVDTFSSWWRFGLESAVQMSQFLSPVLPGTHSVDGSQKPSPPEPVLRGNTVPCIPEASLSSRPGDVFEP